MLCERVLSLILESNECNEHVQWCANLRKKKSNLKVHTSSQPSETQLAVAHPTMQLALDMAMAKNLKAPGNLLSISICGSILCFDRKTEK